MRSAATLTPAPPRPGTVALGFTPVEDLLFTGTFDGQGRTISNSDQSALRPIRGVVRLEWRTAIVRNLGPLNVVVTGGTATGGVSLAENEGTITGV